MAEGRRNFERCWRILEYLRRNTDREHTVTHKELQADEDLGPYVKDIDTLKDAVFDIATAMNSDAMEVTLPPDQWKIVYKAYSAAYGGNDDENLEEEDEDEEKPPKKKRGLPIKDLYYRHDFTYDEVNTLIEGVLFSRTLSTQDANELVEKIKENLTTAFYPQIPKNICTVRETVLADRGQLRENLLLIQQAIDSGVQISFRFNGYDHEKRLQPVREVKDTVSPYYIVANGGRYYLLACAEGRDNMSIWRIDLMTEMEIPGRTNKCKGLKATAKKDVKNLPPVWDETFPLRHLNMGFDQPIPITLRVYRGERPGTDYTFLYDWFGDTFRYVRTETEPPCGDIVQVTCSPFSMVNWALQYSDRVEVLEPKEVRDKVAEKVWNLKQRYLEEE